MSAVGMQTRSVVPTQYAGVFVEHREGVPTYRAYGPRPLMRGRLHAGAFFGSIPAGWWLTSFASFSGFAPVVAVYAFSLSALFGTSAAYHRFAGSPRTVGFMRRADHSMIFVLLAGTYTPICAVVNPSLGVPFMIGIWVLAAIGIVIKLSFTTKNGSPAGSALYLIMGWVAVPLVIWLALNGYGGQAALIAAGGVLYTGGMVVFASRRPDPWPGVFGYHEIWHTVTIIAAGLQFLAIAQLVRA